MSTPIYHITHIDNLPRITQTKGLWCDAERIRQGFGSVGVAHEPLKERRTRTPVQKQSRQIVAAGGVLADYVPFHFCNRSPMLFSIHTGYVAGYDGGQREFVHLVSSVEQVIQGDRRWCFTDGHAVEAVTEFFDTIEELNQLDWSVITHWSWRKTVVDPDRKRRKQAEFLVHQSFPWSWFEQIGVFDTVMQQQVKNILTAENPAHKPAIVVQRRWYYQT